MEETGNINVRAIKLWSLAIVGFIALVIIAANFPVVTIGAGQRGVVFNNVSGIEDRILDEGTHFRTPFVETVHTMSVRVQKSQFTEDTASKDLQRITMDVAVNWQLNPDRVNRIYQKVGSNDTIVDTLLHLRVQQAVKANVSHYTAEQVQTNRDKLASEIEASLEKQLKGYDVIVTNVSIVNLNYTAEFNQVIEQKQIAQQQAEQASYLKLKAENEAKAQIAQADGNAASVKINADAEAYRQQKLQQTLSPELLQKMLIEKWNGAYPTYMMGGSVPLLQLPAH